jgi:microcompartment protein CcmL/EutN
VSSSSSSLQAIAVIETASIARGFVVADAVVKRAPVTVKVARPVSPGRFLLVFGGGVEVTAEGIEAARIAARSDIVDDLYLPGAHAALLPAIERALVPAAGDAVAIIETTTVAAAVAAADVALKAVDVTVQRMRLAVGVGGKGWFSLAGDLADIEAAADAVRAAAHPERLIAVEVIAQPHPELRGFLS